MDDDDPLDLLARWLTEKRAMISRQVTIRKSEGAYGKRTEVAIDHRLSCDLPGHGGWRISTKPTFLSQHRFGSWARHHLKTAHDGRGRAIYCHDLSAAEVVAGMSYHIDDNTRIPVLVTMIALRTDIDGNASLRYGTLSGALVVKQYVHVIADRIGRGGSVDLDLAERKHEPYARELGFRKAPNVKGFRPGGVHLRQPASGS
jgi:hypothetical protein